MGIFDKVKTEIDQGDVNIAILECIHDVSRGHNGLFEQSDISGCYCFSPPIYRCPLQWSSEETSYYLRCHAQKLRDEISSNPILGNYFRGITDGGKKE